MTESGGPYTVCLISSAVTETEVYERHIEVSAKGAMIIDFWLSNYGLKKDPGCTVSRLKCVYFYNSEHDDGLICILVWLYFYPTAFLTTPRGCFFFLN